MQWHYDTIVLWQVTAGQWNHFPQKLTQCSLKHELTDHTQTFPFIQNRIIIWLTTFYEVVSMHGLISGLDSYIVKLRKFCEVKLMIWEKLFQVFCIQYISSKDQGQMKHNRTCLKLAFSLNLSEL